jgi:hypothetical protein
VNNNNNDTASTTLNAIISQVFKQALGLRSLKETVTGSPEVKVTLEISDNSEKVVEIWVQ